MRRSRTGFENVQVTTLEPSQHRWGQGGGSGACSLHITGGLKDEKVSRSTRPNDRLAQVQVAGA